MKTVYRITLWHGDSQNKASVWTSDKLPEYSNGLFSFKSTDGLMHWITGSVEITEYQERD